MLTDPERNLLETLRVFQRTANRNQITIARRDVAVIVRRLELAEREGAPKADPIKPGNCAKCGKAFTAENPARFRAEPAPGKAREYFHWGCEK